MSQGELREKRYEHFVEEGWFLLRMWKIFQDFTIERKSGIKSYNFVLYVGGEGRWIELWRYKNTASSRLPHLLWFNKTLLAHFTEKSTKNHQDIHKKITEKSKKVTNKYKNTASSRLFHLLWFNKTLLAMWKKSKAFWLKWENCFTAGTMFGFYFNKIFMLSGKRMEQVVGGQTSNKRKHLRSLFCAFETFAEKCVNLGKIFCNKSA